MIDEELDELVSEAQAALAAPTHERVSRCFDVLPRVVDALDRVVLYRHELRDTRTQLTAAMRGMREEVWYAQRMHPELTYNAAKIAAALGQIRTLLERLEKLIHGEPR